MRRLLVTLALSGALAVAGLAAGAAPSEPPAPRRVVLVLAPYFMWDDFSPTSTPAIWELARTGALGAINARSRAREPGEPSSPLEGALTISAGAWAVPAYAAAAAYNVDEHYEVGTAAEAFRRMTGEEVRDNAIVFLGMPLTQRVNAERSFEVVLGALGSAIERAGGLTAAIGNSDVGYLTGEQRRVRPAALAAMNERGQVALGDVSTRLVREDPNAPFGIETDLGVFARTLDEVKRRTEAHEGPAFIVLDPGDAYRAKKFEAQVTPGIAERHRKRAVTTLDEVVALAVARFPDDVIIVASQSTGDPLAGQLEGLGPFVINGPGWSGFVTSDSTHRDGIVTNLDLTATVLDIFGIERPVSVLGNEMRPVPASASIDERAAILARADATAVSVDTAKVGVVNTFVVFTVVALIASAVVLVRHEHWSPRATRLAVSVLQGALLSAMAVPLASWLMYAWRRWPVTQAQAVSGLLATTAVVWGLALVVRRSAPGRLPVAVLSLATAVVLVTDQLLGAPASFTNFFGYSPLMAARFYGLGNEAAAILFGSTVVGLALVLDERPSGRIAGALGQWGIPLIGLVVVVVSAAPGLGANVGVAIWATAGFALMWALATERRITAGRVFGALALSAAVIAVFAAIDLAGDGARTHLARALVSAAQGGVGELWTIVARKAATNMRVLTHTNWAYIFIAVVVFLGFMRWRPHGDFARTLAENPMFAHAITVSLVAGLVAYFTEDSGIVIPALEIFYVGVAIAWIMLDRITDRGTAGVGEP